MAYGGSFPGFTDYSFLAPLCNNAADELQIRAHVVFDRACRTVAFELRPFVEAYIGKRVNNRGEIDFSLAQEVRIIFQMNFANALAAKPANLLDDVEAVV